MAQNPDADANARHQIYVERLAATNANQLDPELKALATWLRSRLAQEGGRITTKKALNAVVADVKEKFSVAYTRWASGTERFIADLSDYEAGFQTNILNASTPENYKPTKPTNKSVRSAVKNTPLMIGINGGAVSQAALVADFPKTQTDRAVSLVNTGYYQGRSTTDIIASIVGTKANNYKDGVMATAKRSATSISKTSAIHVTESASNVAWRDNEAAVKGYIFTAVLDSRTTKKCRGLDGLKVAFTDDFQPRPPQHFSCRSVTRPWLREDLEEIKRAEREARGADGAEYEPTSKDYYAWLKQQPAWFQDDVLGKTEGKIFRNSGLSTAEFKAATIKRDGTPLNISEMAEKDDRIAEYLAQS